MRFATGNDSPVNADSSADVSPSMIVPSTGNNSPALTSSSSSGPTSSIGTSIHAPFSLRSACFGAVFSSDSISLVRAVIGKLFERVAKGEKKKQGCAFRPCPNESRTERDEDHQKLNINPAMF